ncbi:hypothetical protein [Streptomyces sp. NPDC002078]
MVGLIHKAWVEVPQIFTSEYQLTESDLGAWPGDFSVVVLALIAATFPFMLLVVTAYLVSPALIAFGAFLGRPWGLIPSMVQLRRFEPVVTIARSVGYCAQAYAAPWRTRPRQLRHLASSLRATEAVIMSVHRTSGHLPGRSHRRRELKVHAGLVVAALRRAEARVDIDGQDAVPELGGLLITVAERITEGRIGALLDDGHLTDLTPARDWEPFRLAAAAVLFAASAVGVSLLHLPDGANAYVIGGCGVVILTLLYGRRAYQFLNVLGTVRGG